MSPLRHNPIRRGAWFVALAAVSAAGAVPVAVDTAQDDTQGYVKFVAAEPVGCHPTATARELILRFARPVEVAGLATLSSRLPAWIESAEQGYDTVLLVTPRDCRFLVHSEDRTTSVWIRPARPAASPGAPADLSGVDAERRTEEAIRSARRLFDEGREVAAVRSLTHLRTEAPDDPRPPAALGDLLATLGCWRGAEQASLAALRLSPDDTEAAETLRLVRAEQGAQVLLHGSRETGAEGLSDTRGQAGVRWRFPDWLQAGVEAGTAHVAIDRIQRVDGTIGPYDGDRQQGRFFLRFTGGRDTWLQADAVAADSGVGARLAWGRPDPVGETSAAADLRTPYWDLTEGFAADATRDRLEIRRTFRHGTRWNAEAAVGGNRYRMDDVDDAATSWTAEGLLSFRCIDEPVSLSLQYQFDAEFVESVASRSVAAGTTGIAAPPEPFNPFPLETRQVHSAGAVLSCPVAGPVRAEVQGGGEWDVSAGEGSPWFGGWLDWEVRHCTASIGISRRQDYLNQRKDVTLVEGDVRFLF